MPIVNIQIAKGRSEDKKQELAEKITTTISEILEIDKEVVTVLFTEYDRESWATGGTLHSIKFGKGFGNQGKNKDISPTTAST